MSNQEAVELRSEPYIKQMFEMLLGRQVKLAAAPAFKLARDPVVLATYVNESGELGGVFVCDIPFGANVGAALSLVPAPEAAATIKKGQLGEPIFGNLREVINVASRLFTTPKTPRVILKEVMVYPCRLDPKVVQYLSKPNVRADFTVEVPGYGPGKFSLLCS